MWTCIPYQIHWSRCFGTSSRRRVGHEATSAEWSYSKLSRIAVLSGSCIGACKLDGFDFIALSLDLSPAFLCNGLGHGHVP